MSRTLKCDKICKYVKISDKIFMKLKVSKNLKILRKQLKTIGQLHDDVTLLQLPESLSVLFS